MNLGAISEPDFAIDQTQIKIHVSNEYLKGFCKLIYYGMARCGCPGSKIHSSIKVPVGSNYFQN
jgi:hypothetical protein